MHRNSIGVIIKVAKNSGSQISEVATRNINVNNLGRQNFASNNDLCFWIFILKEKATLDSNNYSALPITYVSIPTRSNSDSVIECLPYTSLAIITSKQVKVDAENILTNQKKSDILYLQSQILECAEEFKNGKISEFDWSKIRDLDFQEIYREKILIFEKLYSFKCLKCPDLLKHVKKINFSTMLFIRRKLF
jgi:hypothetical protein